MTRTRAVYRSESRARPEPPKSVATTEVDRLARTYDTRSMKGPRAVLLVALACAATPSTACDGNSPSGPTPQPMTQEFNGVSETFTDACRSDHHPFTAADGTVSVTLLSVHPHTSLTLLVCPAPTGGVFPPAADCTFYYQPIAVGQTLEATRQGGRQQWLRFFPSVCTIIGTPPEESFAWRASVTSLK